MYSGWSPSLTLTSFSHSLSLSLSHTHTHTPHRLEDMYEAGESSEEEEAEAGMAFTSQLQQEQVSLSEQLKEEGFIPNAEFIHRARREREEKRQMGDTGGGGAPNFLSLSGKKKTPVAEGKSRLVREDDNDRSDEEDSTGEDGGRRRMDAGQHNMAAVKQLQVRQGLFPWLRPLTSEQVLQGLEERGSDEDEETRRWEEEQILKGVKASAPDQQMAPGQPAAMSALDASFLVGTGGYGDIGVSYLAAGYPTAAGQNYSSSLGVAEAPPTVGRVNSFRLPEKLVPITVESLKSRLTNRLRDLQDSVSGHRRRLEQIRTDLEQSQDEVVLAESQRGQLSLRYQFYQEMRGYLRDLLSCLGEKVGFSGCASIQSQK